MSAELDASIERSKSVLRTALEDVLKAGREVLYKEHKDFKEEFEAKSKALEAREKELKDLKEESCLHEAEFKEKKKLLEVQRKLVKDRNKELEKRTKLMDDRDKALELKEKEVKERNLTVKFLENDVAKKSKELDEKRSIADYKFEEIMKIYRMFSATMKLYETNRRKGVSTDNVLEALDWNIRDEAESWQRNPGETSELDGNSSQFQELSEWERVLFIRESDNAAASQVLAAAQRELAERQEQMRNNTNAGRLERQRETKEEDNMMAAKHLELDQLAQNNILHNEELEVLEARLVEKQLDIRRDKKSLHKSYELFRIGCKELCEMKFQISDGVPQKEFYHKIYKMDVIGPCLKFLAAHQIETKTSVVKICFTERKLKDDMKTMKKMKKDENEANKKKSAVVNDSRPSWDDGESPWN